MLKEKDNRHYYVRTKYFRRLQRKIIKAKYKGTPDFKVYFQALNRNKYAIIILLCAILYIKYSNKLSYLTFF